MATGKLSIKPSGYAGSPRIIDETGREIVFINQRSFHPMVSNDETDAETKRLIASWNQLDWCDVSNLGQHDVRSLVYAADAVERKLARLAVEMEAGHVTVQESLGLIKLLAKELQTFVKPFETKPEVIHGEDNKTLPT